MIKAKSYVPEGYQILTPYLIVEGAERLIDFLVKAFDGKEVQRHMDPSGAIRHAEVRVGGAIVMLAGAYPEFQAMPASINFYVPDVDAAYRSAIAAGGVSLGEPTDKFYGDRSAGVQDPSGNRWWLSTHLEDLALDEIERRSQAAMKP
jgi:uncharacterized glyoxalase superfamily protein PhnB